MVVKVSILALPTITFLYLADMYCVWEQFIVDFSRPSKSLVITRVNSRPFYKLLQA